MVALSQELDLTVAERESWQALSNDDLAERRLEIANDVIELQKLLGEEITQLENNIIELERSRSFYQMVSISLQVFGVLITLGARISS